MKLKSISMVAASLLVLGSCTEDDTVIKTPVQTGEEICFGTSLPSGVQTRTIYGDEVADGGELGKGYFPVYWEDGDQIAILCPQASQGTRVDYKITPMGDNATTSMDVTKIDPDKAGLQWGSENIHRFYGFYPATAAKDGNDDGVVTINIPVRQDPVRWEVTGNSGSKVYKGIGDTDYAYMWAYTKVNKTTMEQGASIPLAFEPMSTVLEITVNGPQNGSMTVSSINVTSVAPAGENVNTILTGDIKCTITEGANGIGQVNCEAVGDLHSTERSIIYINCYNNETNDYPVLSAGDKLIVYAYILPKDADTPKGNIKIRVSPVNQGVKEKTLQTGEVVAHAINKISLPALDADGSGTDINYWMSSLDPDIYLSELSWPGSKMSAVTNTVTENGFTQSTSLTEQFELGVRAFDFPTIAENSVINLAHETFLGNTAGINKTLHDALTELSDCLDKATQAGKSQEAVFVNISYAASRFIINIDHEQEWLSTLISTFNSWSNNKVYISEIDANTTLGDVVGKIILRIHVKDENVYNEFTTELPAQLACYNTPYSDGVLTSMSWGTANNVNGLKLLYEEETRLSDGGILDLNKNDGDAETKKTHVAAVVQESVKQYNANTAHDTWYLIDLGGYYNFTFLVFGSYDGEGVASDLTPYFFDYFNNREQNAALGVVWMNFADENPNYGKKYQCDYLLQTIVDNNFSFPLRMRTGASTKTRSARLVTINPEGWD